MSGVRLLAIPVFISLAAIPAIAQTGADTERGAPLNINKFMIRAMNDGVIGSRAISSGGFSEDYGTYPLRTTRVIYTTSTICGGYVFDGYEDGKIRVTGGCYVSGMVPGAIVSRGRGQDRTDPAVRVYRIRADYATADLRSDAADVLKKPAAQVTDADIAQVRARYARDWDEWPWQLGAPFYDLNGNGVRDPGEAPGLAGADMVLWYAMNDLDTTAAARLYSAPPTGMEVQTTLWGYKVNQHVLANSVFERDRLIYKGTTRSLPGSHVDSMYITRYADTDLGDSGDDLVGSDSLLQLGYTYNGNSLDFEFVSQGIRVPPVLGYVLLQGPLAAGNGGDAATFDFTTRTGRRNLQATSFMMGGPGTPYANPAYSREGGERMYRWMQGYLPFASGGPVSLFRNPDGTATKWAYSGDPRTGSGAVDGMGNEFSFAPGDRKFLLSTGRFSMALGDTQEVVWALVGADGGDRLGNTFYLKWFTKYLQEFYPDLEALRTFTAEMPTEVQSVPIEFSLQQNFPNPFNPTTTIHYSIAGSRGQASGVSQVRLAVYDLLGREVAVLVDGQQAPGEYSVTLSASGLSSGMYFYRLQAGHYTQVRKMMVIR